MRKKIDLGKQLDNALNKPVGEELSESELSKIAGAFSTSEGFTDSRDQNDVFNGNEPGNFIKATWTRRI